MGFRSSRRKLSEDNWDSSRQVTQQRGSTGWSKQSQQESSGIWTNSIGRGEQHFGMTIPDHRTLQRLQMAEDTYGKQVHEWVDEGMPTEIMGKTQDMEAFRQRQADRPPEVPTNIERQHKRSVQRSEQAAAETGAAGETGVPESVRDVIASTGRSLDPSIQRTMEDRMGESLGDVRIHAGPQAASACEAINARAFTVGNHVAFNQGEYDPQSPEGQHVLAHELAHVRQQTSGAVSMLPQAEMELEVDPDPALEREAEETAKQVMEDGPVVVNRMGCEMQIQRSAKDGMLYEAVDDLETRMEHTEQRQEQLMETMLEATPGAPKGVDLPAVATKGAAGFAAGAAAGSVLGPGSAIAGAGGALVGMASAISGEFAKETVGSLMNNRPGGEADRLEEMYHEMAEMYEDLVAARENHGGKDLPGIR